MTTSTRRDRAVPSSSPPSSADNKRQLLIDAAVAVVAREGVRAATTRKIAEQAGVPLGTISYWFSGKEELLEKVVEAMLDKLGAAVPAPETTVVESDMLDGLRAAWQVVEEDDSGAQLALFELTTLSVRTPGMQDVASRQYAMYRGFAAGAIAPWLGRMDPQLPGGAKALAELVAVVFDGMSLAWLADPDGADPQAVFTLLAWLLEQH